MTSLPRCDEAAFQHAVGAVGDSRAGMLTANRGSLCSRAQVSLAEAGVSSE